jgi:hypothetical protein
MRRLHALTLILALLAPAAFCRAESDAESAAESVAATVITLAPPADVEVDGKFEALSLGQLLGPGDRVRTGEGGSLHLVLADGSSLVLGPNTEMTLESLGPGGQGSNTVLRLVRGLMNAIVEKLTVGAVFEVRTANAVAAVKGTDFEVDAGAEDTVVTVAEGTVQLGDKDRRRFEPVLPLHRRRLTQNRLLAAETLARRDANEFHERWARARVFHEQRHELLKHFRDEDRANRVRFRRELLKRRAWRNAHADKREQRLEQAERRQDHAVDRQAAVEKRREAVRERRRRLKR